MGILPCWTESASALGVLVGCVLAGLADRPNVIVSDKNIPGVFFTFTAAARSRYGRCDPMRLPGYLKSLPVDSG